MKKNSTLYKKGGYDISKKNLTYPQNQTKQ